MTENAGHTPGPWTWVIPEHDPGWNDHGPWLVGPDGIQILGGWGHDAWGLNVNGHSGNWNDPVTSPDARLIAAAPALLEACRDMLRWAVESGAMRSMPEGMAGSAYKAISVALASGQEVKA